MHPLRDAATFMRSVFLTGSRLSIDPVDLPSKPFLCKLGWIVLLTLRGYVRNKCTMRASALTYHTLLSIVPVLAFLFGIAKGFGLDQRLEKLLYEQMAGQLEIVEKVVGFARTMLDDAKGGIVAGFGVILMIWTAVSVLNLVESTFNHIWKVPSRSFIRKFTDYLTIMIISPLLFIASSSLTVFITSQIRVITDQIELLHAISPAIFFTFKLLPYGLMWVLFWLIYMVMPNTRVNFFSALVAGLVAGTAFQWLQQGYINVIVLLSRYNAIYGSFAALPLFLIWMHLSWMIVLLGAQIAFIHQRADLGFLWGEEDLSLSLGLQKKVAIHLLRVIMHHFGTGGTPLGTRQLADRTALPATLSRQILGKLLQTGLIVTVGPPSEANDPKYLPAADIHIVRLSTFLKAWDSIGHTDLPYKSKIDGEAINQALQKLDEAISSSSVDRLIIEL